MSKEEKYVTPTAYRIAHAVWDDAHSHHLRTLTALRHAEEEEEKAREAGLAANERMKDATAGLGRWVVDGKDEEF